VPGNCLALAVGVGRQVNLSVRLRQRLDFLDHGTFFIGHAVLRSKIMLDIYRKLGMQQVAHMAN
jgi:hypothetical protein